MDDNQYLLINELALKGNKEAMEELVEFIYNQKKSDLTDEQVAIANKYISILAKEGNARAMLLLGCFFYCGDMGKEQNFREAVYWYTRAAELGDSWALCNLGYCYYYGRDVEVDYSKAYELFAESAYKNNPNASYKLGDMYYYGHHLDVDYDNALYWYARAEHFSITEKESNTCKVSEVYPNVCLRLGMCFLFGTGTERNLLVALEYLQKAERGFYHWDEEGNPFAHINLKKTQQYLNTTRMELESSRNREYSSSFE